MKKRKLLNIIFLDLDDVIIPWNNFQKHNNEKRLLDTVKSNINFVINFCKKNGFRIFLISTWSNDLDNNFNFIKKENELHQKIHKIIFSEENKRFFIGKGNKFDIFGNYDKLHSMLDFVNNNNINKGIIIEDSDFSLFAKENGLEFIHIKNNEGIKKLKNFNIK